MDERLRWAGVILLVNIAISITVAAVAAMGGVNSTPSELGAIAVNGFLAVGLFQGRENVRKWACLRAGLGVPFGFFAENPSGPIAFQYGILNAIWCAGVVVLLWGMSARRWQQRIGTGIVACSQVAVVAWLGIHALPEYQIQRQVRAYSLPGKSISNSDRGYSIQLPPDWRFLKKQNPFLPVSTVEAFAINLRSGVLATFFADTFKDGRSIDNYLDRISDSFTKADNFSEVRRVNISIDSHSGRAVDVHWQSSGERYYGRFSAVRLGWYYYCVRLVSDATDEATVRELMGDFHKGIKFIPGASDPINERMATELQTLNTLLSHDAASTLVHFWAQGNGGGPTGAGGLVPLVQVVEKGRKKLTNSERTEIDDLYSRAFAALPSAEDKWIRNYVSKDKGTTTSSEAQKADALVLKGANSLQPVYRLRLKELFSKLVVLGLRDS